MIQKRRFRVIWEIDVWASSPGDAAKEARRIQTDPESHALVYDVFRRARGDRVDLLTGVTERLE